MKKMLTLLLVLALALALAMPAGADWVRPAGTVETWDEEADFVIVGFGLAGAAAAVEAHDIDPNAKVVVLEKMPESLAGGNSIASGRPSSCRPRRRSRTLSCTCRPATSPTPFRTNT